MIRVAVANRHKKLKLDAAAMRRVLRTVLKGEGIKNGDVSLAFVDDAAIARLNKQYLAHQGPTDVITFPLSEPGEPLAGEIVISMEFARAAARRLGNAPRDEAALYVIHGALHLCGYDDRRAPDRRKMRRREAHYLHKLGIKVNGPGDRLTIERITEQPV